MPLPDAWANSVSLSTSAGLLAEGLPKNKAVAQSGRQTSAATASTTHTQLQTDTDIDTIVELLRSTQSTIGIVCTIGENTALLSICRAVPQSARERKSKSYPWQGLVSSLSCSLAVGKVRRDQSFIVKLLVYRTGPIDGPAATGRYVRLWLSVDSRKKRNQSCLQ